MDFNKWLSQLRKIGRRMFILSAVATATPVFGTVYHFVMGTPTRKLNGIICAIQALAVVVVVMLIRKGKSRFYVPSSDDDVRNLFGYGDARKWKEAKKNARRSLKEFRKFWERTWYAWFFLYAILAAKYLLVSPGDAIEPWFTVAADTARAVVVAMLVFCYLAISMPASVGKGESETVEVNSPPWTIAFFFMWAIQIGAKLLSIHKPMLFAGGPFTIGELSSGIEIFHSSLGALAMAMLCGRLDNKFLKTPLWFTITIYSYALVQLSYAIFGKSNFATLEFVAISLALVFKVLLFLFVTWMLDTGRLLFYFMKVQQIREHEDQDWAKFQEIILPDGIPCREDGPALTAEEIKPLLDQLGSGWNVSGEHHLEKEFEFPDFHTALDFTNRVGELAKEQAHHPNIDLSRAKVCITIWTHRVDGLTKSDFILAEKIDRLLRG